MILAAVSVAELQLERCNLYGICVESTTADSFDTLEAAVILGGENFALPIDLVCLVLCHVVFYFKLDLRDVKEIPSRFRRKKELH